MPKNLGSKVEKQDGEDVQEKLEQQRSSYENKLHPGPNVSIVDQPQQKSDYRPYDFIMPTLPLKR
jgi:hypothetical protein